jgi:hypothetical protein
MIADLEPSGSGQSIAPRLFRQALKKSTDRPLGRLGHGHEWTSTGVIGFVLITPDKELEPQTDRQVASVGG